MFLQGLGLKVHTIQSWRSKKHKAEIMKRSKKCRGGIDAWRYVKNICRPILWPECKGILQKNPNFLLMEDGAAAHRAWYTNRERKKEGIPKAPWPALSPDFNPIEHIWDWMRKEIDEMEEVDSVPKMKKAMEQVWQALSLERINAEIEKLPHIMAKCIIAGGGNNYQA